MRIIKLFLLISVVFLSSCTTGTPPIIEVDCNVTPEHEECTSAEVNCEITPNDPSCKEPIEIVDCSITPEHQSCYIEPVIIKTCEEQNIESCLFTLSEAIDDGTFEPIATYELLSDANQILEESNNQNIVVLFDNKVVDMKYGAVNFKTKSISEVTILGHVGFRFPTYINGVYNVDGLFLDADGIFITGIIAGVHFEVLTDEIELIPHIQTRNGYSYYSNVNNELVHTITNNIVTQSFTTMSAMDQAPSYLIENTRYYSYDNHYFYTDIITMTNDAKNEVRINAINSDNAYYNYYQFLSYRSKTNYTGEELDTYIDSKVGETSALYGTGNQFIAAQESVFINAAMELSLGIHESGWGSSMIARDKNNLFGINAYDSDPYESATSFDSIEECIEYHVSSFLQTRYFNPKYYVSYGTNFGNKYQGMNYKYASDAFWGEKVAKHYYNLDKALGFKDYNFYKIVVLQPDAIGYYGPNLESPIIYDPATYNYRGLEIPFVLVRETEEFYVLQLPLGLNDELEMAIDEIMNVTDVFYVPKTDGTIIN